MKNITTTITETPIISTKMEYKCTIEGCGFITHYEKTAECHSGKHAPKRTKVLQLLDDDYKLFYFETKEDLTRYIEYLKQVGYNRQTSGTWVRAGWYYQGEYRDSYDSNDDPITYLQYANQLPDTWEDKINELKEAQVELAAFLQENP